MTGKRAILGLIALWSIRGAIAAVNPCSESYPTLGTDFVTSQSKVRGHPPEHSYSYVLTEEGPDSLI
jgi:hypothetical protein